jgi:amidase
MEDFTRQPATVLASLIREGRASSEAITRAYLQRIGELNGQYHALVSVFAEEALAAARQCDAELAAGTTRGPLHGVPVTIKESFWMKDCHSTMNFRYFKNFVAGEDAEVVRRIRQAGAVILGQTNVPKLLLDYQVNGDIFPSAKNPFNPACTPGGSTGGGAAALALGMTALELGSDFGGSVRVPAGFCGLYGLKPTDGTVPAHGIVPLPPGAKPGIMHMAQAGPLARSVHDIELLWRIITGPYAGDRTVPDIRWEEPVGHALSHYRLAWLDEWPGYRVSDTVRTALAKRMEQLSAAGCRVERVRPPDDIHRQSLEVFVGLFPYVVAQGTPWWVRKALQWQLERGLLRGMRSRYPALTNRLRRGFSLHANFYSEVLWQRKALIERWEQFFSSYDFLVCPLAFGPAYPRCDTGSPLSYGGVTMPYCDYVWPYSACFNASGHPALSVPLGLSPEGLPVGVQVVGKYWSEPELLRFAKLASGRDDAL